MKYHINVGKRSDSALTDRFPVVGEVSEFRIIEVTDTQLDELRAILLQETGKAECGMVGEDHFIYRLTEDRVLFTTKYEKWPFTAQEWEKRLNKQDRKAAKEREKRDALLTEYGEDAKEEHVSLLPYKPGVYVSKTHHLWFPYRVKYAKKPGQPLLVFFHGGGAPGTDNIRHLYSFLKQSTRRIPGKYDCTVLLPQCSQEGNYEYPEYIAAVKELCERIAAQAHADLSRVYCMGGSFGGYCTWLSAWLFPDFYACAMPLMGQLSHPDLPNPLTPEALAHMKDLPVWVAHSADDTVVPIARDDETVAVLRELGTPVKYTRVDGKGHHYLVPYFFKTEPWDEWMFAQKKSTEPEEAGV